MSYPTCKVKNLTGSILILRRQFEIDEIYKIQDNERVDWAMDNSVIEAIVAEDVEIRDADGAIEGEAAQIAHLQSY